VFGCLGCGDCVAACQFNAIHINKETGLAEVDESKCVACGACVKACPRNIIELRKKGDGGAKMVVLCNNKDRGAMARKNCQNACIGCAKCQTVCGFDAVKVENNLAYIDAEKCAMCRECEMACPTGAIHGLNMPALAKKAAKPAAAAEAEAPAGDGKFDPACAAIIRALPTKRAQFPYLQEMAQKK
jgi:Fe-S-cluster-containing hydrogenase component 2